MKKWKIGILISLTALSLAACSPKDEVVVSMKNGDITKEEFYKELKTKNGDTVLSDMITKSILDDKYKVTDKEVNDRIEVYKKQVGIEKDADFDKFIVSSGSYTSLSAFKKELKASLQQFKATTAGVKVTQSEIDELYAQQKDQIKASHILVADEATANEVYKKIQDGAKFEDMVSQYSTDTQSALNKGSLGYFAKGAMDADFEKAAFSLKKGEISKPVKTTYGYHIIYVEDVKEFSLKELKSSLVEQVKASKAKSNDVIMQNLMKEYKVDIKDSALKKKIAEAASTTTSQQ